MTFHSDEDLAEALYPGAYAEDNQLLFGPSNYSPIVDSFGEVLVRVDDEDYEGDSFVLLKKDGLYGLLIFGWGSCSGCDALQHCESYAEIGELIQKLRTSITWFSTIEQAKRHINSDCERETNFYYHTSMWPEFKKSVAGFDEVTHG